MSKNAEGWIRHRGGKAPVGDDVSIDVRYRDGEVLENQKFKKAEAYLWGHHEQAGDIMAFRLHKPAEQVERAAIVEQMQEQCAALAGSANSLKQGGPLRWRDRIAEIDSTTQALTTERAKLVQKLAREGFALIGRAPDELIGLPREEWQIGDLVILKCESLKTDMPVGEPLPITKFDGSSFGQDVEVDDFYFPLVSDLTWHSRPSA